MTSTGSTTKPGNRDIYLCGDETIRFVEDLIINRTGKDMILHRAALALDQVKAIIACAGSKFVVHSETNHPKDNHDLQCKIEKILDLLSVSYNSGHTRDGWDPDFWIQAAPVHKRGNFRLRREDYSFFEGI